jgi:uncharacterized lipoprotein NlpE involved in copper resistance
MKKSIFRLSAFIVLLGTAFLGCDKPRENAKTVHESTMKESAVMCHANQIYLADIENYKKEAGKAFDCNSKKITAYKVHTDTKGEKRKYDYRQSILELELQNSYMKMQLDEYKPEGKEKWEIFKAEYACQLVALSAEFAGFSEGNYKIYKNEHSKI